MSSLVILRHAGKSEPRISFVQVEGKPYMIDHVNDMGLEPINMDRLIQRVGLWRRNGGKVEVF